MKGYDLDSDLFVSLDSMINLFGELVCRKASKLQILNALSEFYGLAGYYYCLGRFEEDFNET